MVSLIATTDVVTSRRRWRCHRAASPFNHELISPDPAGALGDQRVAPGEGVPAEEPDAVAVALSACRMQGWNAV